MTATLPQWGGPGKKWIKGPHGWHEETAQSEILAESIPKQQVRKIIELFLRSRQQKAFKRIYSCLSAAPVSKCSAKESVIWLQVSTQGSKECHGYSTLGELFRRLCLTGSVWQQGRFNYVMSLTELIIRKNFSSLSGTSRRHLFDLIDALVQRVVETHERIRQMKKIIQDVFRYLMKKNFSYYVGSKGAWFTEVERVRQWSSRLNILTIVPVDYCSYSPAIHKLFPHNGIHCLLSCRAYYLTTKRVDLRLSFTDMPIEVQRHIVKMLSDHRDIESLSHVNTTLQHLCNEPCVWQNLCTSQFTQKEVEECETVLQKRRQKSILIGRSDSSEITWRTKYHFMLKRFEKLEVEEFADPLLLCHRCRIVFWQDSGHPCVAEEDHAVYEKITPRKLISLL